MTEHFSYVADDVEIPDVGFRPATEDVGEAVDLEAFVDAAVSAQRLVVSRLAKTHVKGAMALAQADGIERHMTEEKRFNLPKLVEWTEGNPDVVVEALRLGRLRCRLSARMGLGKSTRLGFYLATQLDFRVLHVALDAHVLQQMSVFCQNTGIGKVSRRWSKTKRSAVSCMTYAEFVGYMGTGGRKDLFASFDLFIFDEAFVASADVYVAKRCFAVYAPAEVNLLLCSATIRTDVVADDTGSAQMGNFKQIDRSISVNQAIESGQLVSKYLVDRTMVIAPDNIAILDLRDHYASEGIEVMVLDDASTYEDVREVSGWLEGDSTGFRILIAHHSYGIGYNLPIAYSIIFPVSTVITVDDRVVGSKLIAMNEEMVTQCKARSGRGMVDGSGGVIMSPERAPAVELDEDQAMLAFVKLSAVHIRPLRSNPVWKGGFDMFPDGLMPFIAKTLLKVCLPVELTTFFLAKDGRICSKYAPALNIFAQPGHYCVPSDTYEPPQKELWITEPLVCAGGGSEMITVPVAATGEIQLILHAIEMIATQRVVVPRWKPSRQFAFADGYDSEEEIMDPRHNVSSGFRMRRIADSPSVEIPSAVSARAIPWSYRTEGEVHGPRTGGYIQSSRCIEALQELERNIRDYRIPSAVVEEIVETADGTATPIIGAMGNIESPGGSVVCTIPVSIAEKMNCGTTLGPSDAVKLILAVRSVSDGFVGSKCFDCYSRCWDSVLNTMYDQSVLSELVKRGLASDAFLLVDKLRGRFSLEVCTVLAKSNVFKKVRFKVFPVMPSMDKVMRAIAQGKFDVVAQTAGFLERVRELKELIDSVLIGAEKAGIWLPTYVTRSQRTMAVRGQSILGYVGDNVAPMPASWQRRILSENSAGESRHMVNKPFL